MTRTELNRFQAALTATPARPFVASRKTASACARYARTTSNRSGLPL
jgi:hypothetical protein